MYHKIQAMLWQQIVVSDKLAGRCLYTQVWKALIAWTLTCRTWQLQYPEPVQWSWGRLRGPYWVWAEVSAMVALCREGQNVRRHKVIVIDTLAEVWLGFLHPFLYPHLPLDRSATRRNVVFPAFFYSVCLYSVGQLIQSCLCATMLPQVLLRGPAERKKVRFLE